ncbi:MAG: SprB repeat-containing protein [Crocinitomicaceae bacterium]|nr:SprB repeat-containing protein [Crocinitomicaceae bacterium]
MKNLYFQPILFFVLFCFNHSSIFSQCDDFEMTVTGENPTCYNYSDGAVTINATGGNGGNEYSISDSTGAIMTWYSGTPNTLVWGWYYCYVIDDMGCELFDSVYLENPGELQPIVYFTDPSSLAACDGIATVDTVLNHQGGYSGIAYFWDPGGPGRNRSKC